MRNMFALKVGKGTVCFLKSYPVLFMHYSMARLVCDLEDYLSASARRFTV